MSADHNKRGMWLLVLYLPVSCLVIGFLSTVMRLTVPFTGRRAFAGVFWTYALRSPGGFSIGRWVAPVLGWGILLLMLVAVRTRKPILTLIEIRVILLVLIVIVALLAKIFTTLMFHHDFGSAPGPVHEGMKNLAILLFLYVNIDLIMILLASYLRIFKSLKRRLA